MKRIANKVAVETICYVVPGNDYIRIVDYPSIDAIRNDKTPDCSGGSIVFDDQYHARTYRETRTFRSQCYGIKAYHAPVTGLNILIFQICTAQEQY